MANNATLSSRPKLLLRKKELVGRCLLALILAQLLTLAVLPELENTPVKATLLTLATSIILCSYLLYPGNNVCHYSRTTINIIWSTLLAIGVLASILLNNLHFDLILILRLTLAVVLLCLLLSSLTRLISHFTTDISSAPLLVFLITTTLTTATIWSGNWIEHIGSQNTTDSIIAISPLTYLASMLDYDYLRSQWFYSHTPYGSLRYHYPHWLSYLIVYLGITALLSFVERQLKIKANNLGSKHHTQTETT